MPAADRSCTSVRRALVATAILLVAAFLRFWQLDVLPGGLHFDLAANLFDMQEVLDGARPLYFPRNTGREPLVIYMESASALIFGVTPLASKVVTAAFGLLSVAATGFVARQAARLARPLDPRGAELAALAAAGLMAGLYWSVHFSRFGLRTAAMPALLALAFGLELRGPRVGWGTPSPFAARGGDPGPRPSPPRGSGTLHWLGAGAFVGLALDTYIGGRIAPIAVALPLLVGLAIERHPRWIGRLALVGVAALAAAWPLVLWYLPQPEMFVEHRGDVFVFSQPDGTPAEGRLLSGIVSTAAAFVLRGSPGIAENLPGRPLFDPLGAAMLVVGLAAVVTWAARSRGGALAATALLGWLVVMALPSALTVPSPGFVRISGAVAPAVVLAAVGVWCVAARLRDRAWRAAVPAAVVAIGCLWTAHDYFGTWQREDAYEATQAPKADAARWLVAQQAANRTFLAPLWANDYAVQFIARDHPLGRFGGGGYVVPTDRALGAIYGFPPEQAADAEAMLGKLPGATSEAVRDPSGQREILRVVRLAPEALPPPVREYQPLEDGVGMVGADFPPRVAPGERVVVTLRWVATTTPTRDYHAKLQLRRGADAVAQNDAQPIYGLAPTTTWRPGDLVFDPHPLELPASLTPGAYTLYAAMYELPGHYHLRLIDAAGHVAPIDEMRLGEVTVAPAP